MRLQQKGWVKTEWGASDNNRRAKFYSLTRAGKKQLKQEVESWEKTSALVARFLEGEAMRPQEIVNRLFGWLRSKSHEQELDEEILTHIEMATEENVRRGMSPHEARQARPP